MHVVFLAPDIDLSKFTGDVWHVRDLAVALARNGCTVDVVVAEPAEWTVPPGIRVKRVPGESFLRAATILARSYGRNPPDVIYERRFSPKLSAVLAALLNRPFLVEINGLVEDEKAMQGRSNRSPRLVRFIRESARGWLLRRSAGVVAVTEGIRDALISRHKLLPNLVTVVPNGVDLDLFKPMPREAARQALRLPSDAKLLIYVGNLIAWQGLPTLLRAMPIIAREVPSVQAMIVGDGRERESLEALAGALGVREIVHFIGMVPRERVALWLSGCDLAVMPATRERNMKIGSSALKLREYLACGLPVVATNIPGAGAFVEREGVGRGCETDDPEAFARAVVSVFGNRQEREAMGRRARALAERDLSWDRCASTLVHLFERAGSEGGG